MKKIAIALVILLIVGGAFLVLRSRSPQDETEVLPQPTPTRSIEPIGEEVEVDFTPNIARTKATLAVSNLNEAGVESFEYEILYEAGGLIKGVNSGSKPIEVPASGTVKRDIDFGTCSSGVCRYDKDVGTITLVIRFNTPEGPKIFKEEYL